MKKQVISESDIAAVVARFERGEFVSIVFTKDDGTHGGYRQAVFARILTITGGGTTYIVDHASTATA